MPEEMQWRKPSQGKLRAGLEKFRFFDELKGQKIKFENIALYPAWFNLEKLEQRKEEKNYFTAAERRRLMGNLHPDIRKQRKLLADTLRLWHKSFPREERQKLSGWIDSLKQNTDPEAAKYYLIVGTVGKGKDKRVVAGSTLHVSVESQELPIKVASQEYAFVHPDFQHRGIYKRMLQKRISLAKQEGAEAMIVEVEPYTKQMHDRYLTLQSTARIRRLNTDELAEIKDLRMRQIRLKMYDSLGYRKAIKVMDPSEGMNFEGEESELDRSVGLNPLWLFIKPLTKRLSSQVLPKQLAEKLYRSYLKVPQDVDKEEDIQYILSKSGKLPAQIRTVRPMDILRKHQGLKMRVVGRGTDNPAAEYWYKQPAKKTKIQQLVELANSIKAARRRRFWLR